MSIEQMLEELEQVSAVQNPPDLARHHRRVARRNRRRSARQRVGVTVFLGVGIVLLASSLRNEDDRSVQTTSRSTEAGPSTTERASDTFGTNSSGTSGDSSSDSSGVENDDSVEPEAEVALAGTSWTVSSMEDQSGETVPVDFDYALSFSGLGESAFTVFNGCVGGSGPMAWSNTSFEVVSSPNVPYISCSTTWLQSDSRQRFSQLFVPGTSVELSWSESSLTLQSESLIVTAVPRATQVTYGPPEDGGEGRSDPTD